MSEPTTTRRRPRIWIVDDSPTEGLNTERALASIYEVERYSDGSVVIERLSTGGALPDVILLDWVMPGMTGLEITRFLRGHPDTRELPIVLVTASRVETADIVEGLAMGANDYVAKPFVPEELRARIDSILRAKHLSRLAAQERARLAMIAHLGRALFEAGPNIERICDALAAGLSETMCDGCSVLLLPGALPPIALSRHRAAGSPPELAAISTIADPEIHGFASSEHARATLPPAYHDYIQRFGLRGLAILPFPIRTPIQGVITVTRDGSGEPFAPDDVSAIETAIEYAALAVQNAIRFEGERAVAAERERFAAFQQRLLGIVGHDLRNPLAAITAGIGLLEMRAADQPELLRVLERLDRSTRRMSRIVDDLFDITRVRLGDPITIRVQLTALVPLVRSVVDELASAKAGSKFELIAEREVEGLWDPDRLGQVVSNLVGNAVAYGRAGAPIEIVVSATGTDATIAVKNAVRDQPIAPDQLAGIFDPFRRGVDRGDNTGGLGLGLHIANEIVRAHGGAITADSTEAGTVFAVRIPLAPPPPVTG